MLKFLRNLVLYIVFVLISTHSIGIDFSKKSDFFLSNFPKLKEYAFKNKNLSFNYNSMKDSSTQGRCTVTKYESGQLTK